MKSICVDLWLSRLRRPAGEAGRCAMWKKMVILVVVVTLIGSACSYNQTAEKPLPKETTTPPASNHEPQATKIKDLIKQLGDEDWDVRKEATEELIKIGKPTLFPLIDALDSEDPEVGGRAKRILNELKLEPDDLNEDEVSLIEKKGKEAKGETKELLQNLIGKWRGFIVSGLHAAIRSDKKVYKVGEKIIIEFRLTNVSKQDIYIGTKPSGFTTSTIYFDKIIGPEGSIRPTVKHIDFGTRPPPLKKSDFTLIRPQKNYTRKIKGSLCADTTIHTTEYYNLDKPGKYKITMLYRSNADGRRAGLKVKAWTGKVISNTITIEIKE